LTTQRIKLGVNIDHVATLRNARGENDPSLVQLALIAESAGADLITIHLREDRRHIRDADVFELKEALKVPINFEMSLSDEILDIALRLKPETICLVPERREEVTTEGGLDVLSHIERVKIFTRKLKNAGCKVFPFIEPDLTAVAALKESGVDGIEFHTGSYARKYSDLNNRKLELNRLVAAAEAAHIQNLEVHAGHGLNLQNVKAVCDVPHVVELNIGHAIIARALTVGLATAIGEMRSMMDKM